MLTQTDLIILFLKREYLNTKTKKIKELLTRTITFINILTNPKSYLSYQQTQFSSVEQFLIYNKSEIEFLFEDRD